MLFHRIDFFVFFLVIYLIYILLTRKAQNVWLLAASYFFYGMWDWRFLSLLWLSTLVDFIVGWLIGAKKGPARRWLIISIVVNLGILATFKYANFFVDNFVSLLHTFGWQISPHIPAIILPVGISFYTFQSMSYTIDVYRGATKPCYPHNLGPTIWSAIIRTLSCLADFALYVSFFPQLVAGPIERSTRLLGQILNPRRITSSCFGKGCWLFFLGLVMKIAIADEIAPQVDVVYTNVASHNFIALYYATFAFAIQIYCDFAGYSYMARGVAAMMGFDLMINFRQPYLASSFSDFWRRWHISLSTWIRDYVYIPLGGNKISSSRTYVNLLIAMGLAGLWHGSTWAFIAWGLLHGFFLAIERWVTRKQKVKGEHKKTSIIYKILYGNVVFHGVLLGWFLFRVGDLSEVIHQLQNLQGGWSLGGFMDMPRRFPELLPYISFFVLLILYEWPCRIRNTELLPGDFRMTHRLLLYVALITMLLAAGGQKDAPFIYFQF